MAMRKREDEKRMSSKTGSHCNYSFVIYMKAQEYGWNVKAQRRFYENEDEKRGIAELVRGAGQLAKDYQLKP